MPATTSPQDAYALGTLDPGSELDVTSYFWHYFDWDWYRVHVPEGPGGTLSITLDYQESFDANGWYETLTCEENPYGIKNWLYLFDQTWYEGSQEFSDHLTRSTDGDVSSQTVQWELAAGDTDRDYYVLVMARENWDQENPYTVTVSLSD